MIRFRYRAARPDGATVTGILTAGDAATLEDTLLREGLFPLHVEPAPVAGAARSAARRDLAIVFRSLTTLVQAGVPLSRALAASQTLPRDTGLRETLRRTATHLTAGASLSAALEQGGPGVPAVVLGMLRAGERGGELAATLDRAAEQLAREAELAGRIRQALAYPAILLVAGLVSVGVITLVVVPRFAVLLADLGQQLPPATRLLLGIGELLQQHGALLLVLTLAGALAAVAWARSAGGRVALHRALLQLPLIGPVRHGFASSRAARAAGAMLSTGVPILGALRAAEDAAGDAEVGARLARARTRIESGASVADAFREERVLTPAALQVLSVGDASGQLGPMAIRAGDLAAGEAEGRLRVLVSLLEPGLVVVFGGMVAFTAAALLQAVYSLRPTG